METKPRIGIIDDNPFDLDLFKGWFEAEGCQVFLAKNTGEAESILTRGVDIALVDVRLGQEFGLKLAEKIKKQYPLVLVILMTGALRSIFCFDRPGIQCIEKTSLPELFVPIVMNFWEIEHRKELESKARKIQELLPYKDTIGGVIRKKGRGREVLTGRLFDPERRDISWVVYDGYPGHGNTIDICLAVLYGCFGKCRQCFSGLHRTNARKLGAVEMLSQFLHALDSVHAKDYLNRKISVSFSNEGDSIFNWKKVMRVIFLLSQVKELDISFVINTIGNVKVFRRFVKAYEAYPEKLPIKIYLSLHSLAKENREWLLPATKGQSLEEIREVLAEFSKISEQRVTLSWLLIKGFNDSDADIEDILSYLDGGWGEYFDVKVMPFKDDFLARYGFKSPATMADAQAFADKLEDRGISARAKLDLGILDGASMGSTIPDFDGFKPTA